MSPGKEREIFKSCDPKMYLNRERYAPIKTAEPIIVKNCGMLCACAVCGGTPFRQTPLFCAM